MWVGTFHSLAHRLLRLHWKDAKLPETFQILDSEDQYRLIRRLMRNNLDLDEEKYQPRQAQWYINNKKDQGLRAKHVDTRGDFFEETMLRVYLAYEEACERSGLVDFAELLLRAHELWRDNPPILQHYQQRFKHILVDEFQDTNTIQYAWLRLLTTKNNNIMVVGDDDQSIYGWRGAKIENIHQFHEHFADAKIIRLEQNYRSTGNILKTANALIENNTDRLGKNLWTQGAEGEKVSLYAASSDWKEAEFIVNKILALTQKGLQKNDCAVLYRSNAQSRVIEEALMRMNVPYRVYGGLRFFDRAEIKDALAYLHLMVNRNNDAAFERVINKPARGIGNITVAAVRKTAREKNISLWQAVQTMLQNNIFPVRAGKALLAFINLIERVTTETKSLPLHEQVEHAIYVSGLSDYYRKQESGEKSQTRIENLEELITAARQFNDEEGKEFLPLSSFLAQAALEAGETQADPSSDYVQLMTLHSAKGLEFPVVFLAGVEEGLFPHKLSLEEPGRLEEERRLCYVGITRAKQKLYISHAETRRLHGYETIQTPSRFIRELPKECLEEIGIKAKVSYPRSFQTSSKINAKPMYEETVQRSEFRLGEIVFHPTFGEGIISNFEGVGLRARIQVEFKKAETKWLVAEFAHLKKRNTEII